MNVLRVLIALAIGLSAQPGQADMIDTDGLKPWETCALCHGLDGVSRMAKFPRLANQPYTYLVKQLEDFRDDRRANDGGMMVSNAQLLSSESLQAVARYFSEQPAPKPFKAKTMAGGRSLFEEGAPDRNIPACATCHNANPPDGLPAPRLESQHADYLAKQLRDFKDGGRSNDKEQVMRRIASQLSAMEIEAVAGFAATLKRE